MAFLLAVGVAGIALATRLWPHEPLRAGTTADLVLVEKGKRTLSLMRDGQVLRTYPVSLGRHPQGHKAREGDGRTPEGRYVIDFRNARSGFYRALRVSYPDAADRQHAAALNVPPGGDIMIHGIRNGLGWLGPLHRLVDWTDGCVALTNAEMADVWEAVPQGTPVEIRP